MHPNATLHIQHLIIERGEKRICGPVSFSLKAGQAVQVKGVNGAGKSSLLKGILGLMPSDSGKVIVNWENDVGRHQTWPQCCLYLGHTSGVKRFLSVIENLRFYHPHSSIKEIDKVLARFSLSSYKDTLVHQLSQGQAHRVALCRLLLSQKMIWVLDEPFTSLDEKGRELVEGLMQQHLQCQGMIIFTSHLDLIHFEATQVLLP